LINSFCTKHFVNYQREKILWETQTNRKMCPLSMSPLLETIPLTASLLATCKVVTQADLRPPRKNILILGKLGRGMLI
jgi:hypothetical protein